MKKSILFLAAMIIANMIGWGQTQRGSDINGEAAYDESGCAVSMPDANTVAIGAIYNDGSGSSAGHVRVFRWNGTAWVQKGADIEGEAVGDNAGTSLDMPDASTIAIGAVYNDGGGNNSGHVRVFSWNGTAWVQKGADIDGEALNDQSGRSVSMPDASTVAIGSQLNDGAGSDAGHVRVYKWNGTAWVQKGADIDGEAAGDGSGLAVSMPDASTVAVGAPLNDGSGSNAGHVRIYSWSGTAWVQKGADIDGEAAGDGSGIWGVSVSMPDASTVAIGAPYNDGAGNSAGHVRIFRWNGSAWVQKGTDIDGAAADDYAGWSVSMPDTSTVAVSSPYNDDGGSNSGHVRVFRWSGTAWLQVGVDIQGDTTADLLGHAVSMPDASALAIGIPFADGGAVNTGAAKVFSIPTPPVAQTKPAIKSYTPVKGALAVMTSVPLTISFDKAVTKGGGNIYLRNRTLMTTKTIPANSGDVSVTGSAVTISNLGLIGGCNYHVTLDSTAFDSAGIRCTGLYDTANWWFRTAGEGVGINGVPGRALPLQLVSAANGLFQISSHLPAGATLSVVVYDLAGRRLASRSFQAGQNDNHFYIQTYLPPGTYILIADDGRDSGSLKAVMQ